MSNTVIKIGAASPRLRLGDADANAAEHVRMARSAAETGVSVLVFPELSLTGYTCGDLFYREDLLDAAIAGLVRFAGDTASLPLVSVLGLPFEIGSAIYNVAAVVSAGRVWGLIPKTFLPTYGEYYETRQFTSARHLRADAVDFFGQDVPIGTDLVFASNGVRFAVELCEDLWTPVPPSSRLSGADLDLVLNLSASTDFLGKSHQRRERVTHQSAVLGAAYAMACAGVGESSCDAVFGGCSLIAAEGRLIAEGKLFAAESACVTAPVDLAPLRHHRRATTSLSETAGDFSFREVVVELEKQPASVELDEVSRDPFGDAFCGPGWVDDLLAIQAAGLVRRLKAAHCHNLVIGVSGGADSALALLGARAALMQIESGRSGIDPYQRETNPGRSGIAPYRVETGEVGRLIAVVMPGFASSTATQTRAATLAAALGAHLRIVDITGACQRHLADIGHDDATHDTAYENVQARERTQVLMDVANMERALVVGTGDLSEIALGWNTYNGDHMSMYQLNASVPKTMVLKALAEIAARSEPMLKDVLKEIAAAPITPELVPDAQANDSEARLGPYELHDFFLYHYLADGASRERLLALAQIAFRGKYDAETLERTRDTFWRRFFAAQYKRNCVPDGPKITLSLSPRADWRMPSDLPAPVR